MPDRKNYIVWRKYFDLGKIVIWISKSGSQHPMARKSSRNKTQKGKTAMHAWLAVLMSWAVKRTETSTMTKAKLSPWMQDCKKFHWLHKGVSAKVADALFSDLGGAWAWQCNARKQYTQTGWFSVQNRDISLLSQSEASKPCLFFTALHWQYWDLKELPYSCKYLERKGAAARVYDFRKRPSTILLASHKLLNLESYSIWLQVQIIIFGQLPNIS